MTQPQNHDLPVDRLSRIPEGAYAGVERAADNAERGWWDAARAEIEALARSRIESPRMIYAARSGSRTTQTGGVRSSRPLAGPG